MRPSLRYSDFPLVVSGTDIYSGGVLLVTCGSAELATDIALRLHRDHYCQYPVGTAGTYPFREPPPVMRLSGR